MLELTKFSKSIFTAQGCQLISLSVSVRLYSGETNLVVREISMLWRVTIKNKRQPKEASGLSPLLAFVIVSLLPKEILASILMWICPCLCFLTGSLEGAERASVKKGGGSLILSCLLSLFLF